MSFVDKFDVFLYMYIYKHTPPPPFCGEGRAKVRQWMAVTMVKLSFWQQYVEYVLYIYQLVVQFWSGILLLGGPQMKDCSHAQIYCAMADKKNRDRSFNQWQHCVRDQTLASTAVVVWSQKIPSQKAITDITPRLNQRPCCSGAKFIISQQLSWAMRSGNYSDTQGIYSSRAFNYTS